MATPRSRQIFRWRRRRRLHFVLFFMLFYSIELIHIHCTCQRIYFAYLFYIYLLFVHRRQIVSADAPHGASKDSKTIYATPMVSKFGIDFM